MCCRLFEPSRGYHCPFVVRSRRSAASHGTGSSSLQDLLLQALGSHLGLEHTADALLPRLLQRLDLAVHALLLRAPQRFNLVVLAPHVGQLGLDVLENVLELRVADQPGILAKLLQQCQLGQAALDVL